MKLRGFIAGTLLSAAVWLCLLALVSCLAVPVGPVATAARLTQYELPGIVAEDSYAVVRSEALPRIQAEFERELARLGVRAGPTFDCNRLATYWISLAQVRYALEVWHRKDPPQALALAEVWYTRADRTRHAIVLARTERGDVYLEPQTGAVVQLTPQELDSIVLRKW